MSKRALVALKFISDNYDACEVMLSFIKNLRHAKGKNPSSTLRFKHENFVFIKTTHAKNSVDSTFTKL